VSHFLATFSLFGRILWQSSCSCHRARPISASLRVCTLLRMVYTGNQPAERKCWVKSLSFLNKIFLEFIISTRQYLTPAKRLFSVFLGRISTTHLVNLKVVSILQSLRFCKVLRSSITWLGTEHLQSINPLKCILLLDRTSRVPW
jgi:hypothetical protein